MAVPDQEDLLLGLAKALAGVGEGMAAVAKELHRTNQIHVQRLVAESLDRSIDDPVLAEALLPLDGTSADKRRQMLFANRHYGLVLLAYQVGVLDRGELLGALKIMIRSPVFVEYWARTAEARTDLPVESIEARIGRAIDAIVDERLGDLEEWWVVGSEESDQKKGHPPSDGGD
ncbi:DUF6082 family protein [Streptomyces sp. NPDC047081]|uniref:DUF6082 family protein n=1 Tax=Streptomyces sp. NPDC047081 TaxID=3154706 RepID=UPI0034083842